MNSIAKIIYVKNTKQTQKVRQYFLRNNIPFEEQYLRSNPLAFDDLKEILKCTTNGVEEIIGLDSSLAKALKQEGIHIDRMTIKQLHWLVQRYPNLLKNVITFSEGKLVVGANEDELGVFITRSRKRELFRQTLESFPQSEISKPLLQSVN